MLVLHPDLLLSGTRISGSFRCQRQSVLEERFAGSSNDKAVEGTLMHEVFQVTCGSTDLQAFAMAWTGARVQVVAVLCCLQRSIAHLKPPLYSL